ncbi:hypothetical protein BDF19DRAFT_455550 [Syncephalis fuscata]|nr:hypothetical protein BDF19DRAFT_455550 [Syncephalis fuscata]
MPAISLADIANAEWTKNATTFWGILLHPLGEMNILDYYMQPAGSLNEQRGRLFGNQLQTIIVVLTGSFAIRNMLIAIKIIIRQPRSLVSWCCAIPSLIGILTSCIYIMAQLGCYFNCRHIIWSVTTGISFATFANSLILLRKAYLVINRKKWVIYIGLPFMLLQHANTVLVVLYCYYTLDPIVGCVFNYPHFIVWHWFSAVVPLNVLFSVIFIRVALNQYRLFGSDAWRRLARDGIQTMCLTVLCNIVSCIFIVFEVGGAGSDIFFSLDWVIVSTILINHCQNMRKSFGYSYRPKTHFIDNISQIATAKSLN